MVFVFKDSGESFYLFLDKVPIGVWKNYVNGNFIENVLFPWKNMRVRW